MKLVAECTSVLQRGGGGAGPHQQSTPTAVTNCLLSRCLSCPLAASGVWRGDPSGVPSRPRIIRRGRVSVGAVRDLPCCLLRHATPRLLPRVSPSAPPSPDRSPARPASRMHPSSSGNLLVWFYRWLAHLIWLFIHL